MARKVANLESVLFAQDFLPEHWDWSAAEKSKLGDVEEMGKIIKSRLENGGCEIVEMYAIKHDKDENKIWDEYQMIYVLKFTSNHVHFVIKFQKGKGKTLTEIASLIGIEPNFIEKPKRGRYAYDNMLSYLTHIKYDKKYQYNAHSVYTFAGKAYIDHYRERHETWMRGRAEKSVVDAKQLLNYLKVGIAKGEILLDDIVMNEEWKFVYILHKDQLDKIFEAKKETDNRREKLLSGQK